MQQLENKNIAIFSPNEDAFSESFIQAHKTLLKGKIFYFHSGLIPSKLEGHGSLFSISLKIKFSIKKFLHLYSGSISQYALKTSLLKNKIDCILIEYGYTGAETFDICKDCKIPIIVHFHGSDSSHRQNVENYKEKYYDMFDYATYVIAVSKTMVKQLKVLGCSEDKIIYSPCGPSENFYNVSPTFDHLNILFIGRFVDKKAPYYLIFAFAEVLKEFPLAKLSMIGDGFLKSSCEDIVNYLGIQKNINFLGSIPHSGIFKEIENSYIYAQHSITSKEGEKEGTPVSIMEAQAAGLPVVSTYHAGIGDVVVDGETGYLVEEHDVKGMADRINALFSDQNLARQMGKNARERIKKNFNLDQHISKLDEAIENALQRS